MEEGSLRCDANISLKEKGETELGVKVEIKNLNSFKAVRDALIYEEERQEEVLSDGGTLVQETRLWDETTGTTISMRTKEGAQDYRYFPEPDLVPFEVSSSVVSEIKETMPELPAEKKERYRKQYKLDEADIDFLTTERDIADYFEAVVVEYNEPKIVCNWIKGEIMMHLKEKGVNISGLALEASNLAMVIRMEKEGKISGLASKEVLKEHIDTGASPEIIVKEKGLEQVSDTGELETIVLKVVSGNQKSAEDYRAGKTNALSFLIGQVMKETKGKANPKIVGAMLREKLQ